MIEDEKKYKRVAVFPAGSEIGLEINQALKYSTFFDVVGLSSVSCHASYVFKEYYEGIPFYTAPDFIECLNLFIREKQIDFIYPAYDDVQLFLTEHEDRIKAKIVTSELRTVRICRNKSKTYDFFEHCSFIPKTYTCIDEITTYPVFAKPDIGQGSHGIRLIHNEEEAMDAFCTQPKFIVCEYLPGDEFTIDCFTDCEGTLLACNMRNRKRIRNGISVASQSLKMEPDVLEIANMINRNLKFCGAWFFQLKKNVEGNYRLLEIAPRIAGTMGLSRNTGINFPLLTLFAQSGFPVSVIQNQYSIEVDRALISRYCLNLRYETVYVDLDDTLIIKQQVNTLLIMFLYQCVNANKTIILLTKHLKDVKQTLEKHRITPALFNMIVKIAPDQNKTDYIKETASIFIDDSFSERKKVWEKCRIPVFDCSEVESLLDWR
ncbi:ATP-grasp domain-containing protein [Clostridium sp. AF18-27]|uniref:ATP-grasp domain-containing protein n=1 Tax=Enterocloster lavalensis TaxID=460384 RepID=UPI000E50DEF3|nr:ATP-grasp domain-containing protein [Enterocloster lavalensis]RHR51895.1 ATP-grasp domain-containing protein [Clostridium sp. AF18-27]